MLSVPQSRSGARISWLRGPSGELVYKVVSQAGSEIRMNPGMALVALLGDGRRTLLDIYQRVRKAGIAISDPAHVVLTFQRLEETRAVDIAWHFESLGEVRHACTGCGRSCEGHLIGPLSPSEIPRLKEYKERLRLLEPDLPEGEAVVEMPGANGPEPCLNTLSGRCVFFTRDRLCAIHKHFGGELKPLHCQLFPLRVVETETGLRVGISGRCAMTHRSWRSGPAQSAGAAVMALPLRRPPSDLIGLDPRTPRSFAPTPAAQRNRVQEEYFLELLEAASSLGEVAASSDGARRPGSPPDSWMASAARRLRAFAAAYQHDPLDRPETLVGSGVRAFLKDLSILEAPATWVEPAEPVRAYVIHALRQLIYLRELISFGSIEIGVQVALVGFLGAMWTVETSVAGDVPSDPLGVRLAIWQRMQNGGRVRDLLFEDFASYREHLALLAQP